MSPERQQVAPLLEVFIPNSKIWNTATINLL